jgi:hypothetical protein
MSDVPVRSSASVPRAELRAAFGSNSRLIKAFENLFEDVANILPGGVDANTQAAAEAADSADAAQALALVARAVALHALAAAEAAQLDPGLGPLRAEISRLRSRIDTLEQGIRP